MSVTMGRRNSTSATVPYLNFCLDENCANSAEYFWYLSFFLNNQLSNGVTMHMMAISVMYLFSSFSNSSVCVKPIR